MPQASAVIAVPVHAAHPDAALRQVENPGLAFANGLMLALPLWGLIGVAIWAIV